MTDLTEKWKKGELLEGFYYVKCDWSDEVEIRYVHNGVDEWKAIVAEVPSYDDWQALMDLYKEADVIIKKSDKENIKIKTDCHTLAQKLLQVKPELKEWLETNFKEYL